MKTQTISNITATIPNSTCDWVVIGWETDDARYHVNCDLPSLTIRNGGAFRAKTARRPTIYKNPHYGIKYGSPEHFQTRYLDARSSAHEATLALVFEHVNKHGLIAKARKALEDEERRIDEEIKARALLERKCNAGPRMFDLLERMLSPTVAKLPIQPGSRIRTDARKLVDEILHPTEDSSL